MKNNLLAMLFFCCALPFFQQAAGIPAACAAQPQAAAQASAQSRPELTVDDLLRFTFNSKARDFSTGPEEEACILAVDDNSEIPRQLRLPGIHDALFEQFVFNKRFFMPPNPTVDKEEEGEPSMLNPDVWMLSAHYPQNTGHAAIDAFLKEQAKRFFMRTLPVDPENIHALNPEKWLASQSFSKNKKELQLFFESFTATRRHYLNGGVRPDAQGGTLLLYQTVITYTITRPSARYFSVVFTSERYLGGAHNNWTSEVFSFDRKTGKRLQAGELFTGTAKQRARLQKRLEELAAQAGIDYDHLPNAFQAMFADPRKIPLDKQKVALTRDGLVFIYDPYEIASYGQGTILLTVPVEELKECGINTRFWQ